MNQSASPYRHSEPERAALSQFQGLDDVQEALLQQVQGGELHLRQPLQALPGSPFLGYIEIGCALRACLRDPAQRGLLAQRLWPCADLIIGTLPAGIQPQGLLPELSAAQQHALGFRPLAQISEEELRAWVLQDGSIIYGELKRYELENYFEAIAPLLRRPGTMIDLGSGLGKVVLTAALCLPFERCIGVELLSYRHELAQQRLAQLLAVRDTAMAALAPPLAPDATLALADGSRVPARHLQRLEQRITLIEQDMFAADLSEASLVFIYSTCFGALMPALAERLARALPPLALVSTATYALRHPAFRLVQEFPAQTLAWTTIYVYERIAGADINAPAEPAYRLQHDRVAWQARLHEACAQFDQHHPR